MIFDDIYSVGGTKSVYFYVFSGRFRHIAQRHFTKQKSLEVLIYQGFQGFSAWRAARDFADTSYLPRLVHPTLCVRYRASRSAPKTCHRHLFLRRRPFRVRIPCVKTSKTKKNTAHKMCTVSFGALQGIRTPDLLVRSQTLYPAELAAQIGL